MNQGEYISNVKDQSPAAPNTMIKVVRLFGIPVQVATLNQALDRVHNAITKRESTQIGVVNAAKIVNMRRDPKLRAAVFSADVVYADGMSVVWASRFLGKRLPERVAGIDLMTGILDRGRQHQYRVYCLGAKQNVVEKVCKIFESEYPGVIIAGWHDGYFPVDDEQSVAKEIRDSKPDVLLVAITSPKKEQFMARWAKFMNIPVIHGVGGSFDVIAGRVKRAPAGWQKAGLEWLYRTLQEPRRLWKRYLVTNTIFIGITIKEAVITIFSSSGRE